MKQAVCIIAPAVWAWHVEAFLAGLDNVRIDSVVDGRAEKFVDFYFMGKRFMIHWNVDQWLLFQEESGADREFTALQALIARKNTVLGGYVCILKGMLKAFFGKR